MMMIRVTDNNLKTALFIHLIEQLERGDLAELLENGACPKSMDRLRNLAISDLLHLASSGHPDIFFSISENGFDLGIETLDRRKEESGLLVNYIQAGASQSMLNQFFPTTDTRIIQSYRRLLKADRRAGRTALPDGEMRDLIHKNWFNLSADYPTVTTLREKLWLLHSLHRGHNTFDLDVLYAIVNEFNNQ